MKQMTLFDAAPVEVTPAACGNTVGTAEKSEPRTAADDLGGPYVDEGPPEPPAFAFLRRVAARNRRGDERAAEAARQAREAGDAGAAHDELLREYWRAQHEHRQLPLDIRSDDPRWEASWDRLKSLRRALRAFRRAYPSPRP